MIIPRDITLKLALQFINEQRARCNELIDAKTFDPYIHFVVMETSETVH